VSSIKVFYLQTN